MYKRANYQGTIIFFLVSFWIFLILPPSNLFAQNSTARGNNGLMQIKAENGLLSVKLENASLTQVLQEIARQTGVQFVGWENAEGKVTQEFENLPLDEGLKKISQSFIMVLKKTGEEGKPLRVEKVIIIAQKNASSATSESKPEEEPESSPSSPPPSGPVVQPETEIPQAQVTPPPPQKAELPTPADVPVAALRETPRTAVADESEPKAPTPKSEQRPKGKKKRSSARTASLGSSTPLDRARGEEYFKQKRWDMAITCFGRYLEQNPSDQEVREQMETAKQNAEQAISIYRQGKKFEDERNLESAYDAYKKTCDIYPLLYDAWERMNALQQQIKR